MTSTLSPVHPPKTPDYSVAIRTLWPDSINEDAVESKLTKYLDAKKAILCSDLWTAMLAKIVKKTAPPLLASVDKSQVSTTSFRRGIIAAAAIVDGMVQAPTYAPHDDPLVRTLQFTELHAGELGKLVIDPYDQNDPSELGELSMAIGGEQAVSARMGMMLVFRGIATELADRKAAPTNTRR